MQVSEAGSGSKEHVHVVDVEGQTAIQLATTENERIHAASEKMCHLLRDPERGLNVLVGLICVYA